MFDWLKRKKTLPVKLTLADLDALPKTRQEAIEIYAKEFRTLTKLGLSTLPLADTITDDGLFTVDEVRAIYDRAIELCYEELASM